MKYVYFSNTFPCKYIFATGFMFILCRPQYTCTVGLLQTGIQECFSEELTRMQKYTPLVHSCTLKSNHYPHHQGYATEVGNCSVR